MMVAARAMERIKAGATLHKHVRAAFYGGGTKGYTDDPLMATIE